MILGAHHLYPSLSHITVDQNKSQRLARRILISSVGNKREMERGEETNEPEQNKIARKKKISYLQAGGPKNENFSLSH